MTTTERRTLSAHVEEALTDQAVRVVATLRDDERGRALREELALWYLTAHERLSVELRVELTRRGRKDPRSAFVIVWLATAAGTGELLRVRVRDLCDLDGHPIDPRTTVRDLRDQMQAAPDTVPAAWLDGGQAAT